MSDAGVVRLLLFRVGRLVCAAEAERVREILPWLIFAALLVMMIYFVGVEEGATSIFRGMYVHEFVHDGRHLLGFPCH